METFDVNTNSGPPAPAPPPPGAEPTNPFEMDLAAPPACPQKAGAAAAAAAAAAGLLLDLAGDAAPTDNFQMPPFNNGHTNGNLYDFLDRSPNGKVTDEDDDEDSGNENAVDGVDEKHASLLNKNPFGADIELQRQQLSEFDPENEPRHDTPTPPADEVPGVIGLVSDNVAESGEESEDEWNYYRVEPSEKSPQPSGEKEQQTTEKVCQEQPEKVDEEDMESQLNPNAAEFIPSPTNTMPSMEEFILSQTKNETSMDDVVVPSRSEFEKEVSSRPGEVDFDNSFFNSSVSSANTSDFLAATDKEFDKSQEFSVSEREKFVNPLTVQSEVNVEKSFNQESTDLFDESAAFSTKAEYGDESTTSFMTNGSDFQKVLGVTNIMETSLMEQDFLASEENVTEDVILENKIESTILEEQEPSFQQDVIQDFQKEPVHISFELQKEIAPQMESQPERVKVDSTDHSPILESEPDLERTSDLTEDRRLIENLELTYKNEASTVPGLEDFVTLQPVSQDVRDYKAFEESPIKLEDTVNITTPKVDELDILKEVEATSQRDTLLEFSRAVEKSILDNSIESQATGVDLGHSGYLPDDFKENIVVQQEIQNKLSNEISTPEYEKLEKVVEAAEVYQEHFNTLTEDISVNFSSDKFDVSPADGVLLESSHPDKMALLDDACAESNALNVAPIAAIPDFIESMNITAPESGEVKKTETISSDFPAAAFLDTISSESALLDANRTEVDELCSGSPLDSAPLDTAVIASLPLDITSEATLQGSSFVEESVSAAVAEQFAPLHIPSVEAVPSETLLPDILGSALAPPPTPLITQVSDMEPLNFSRGTEDITEIAEKLSATGQVTEVNSVSEANEIMEAAADSILVHEIPSAQTSEDISTISAINAQLPESIMVDVVEPEKPVTEETASEVKAVDSQIPSDLTAAAVAASGVAAAVAATVAVATSSDKIPKKETPPKKTAVTAKDKRPIAEKPKTTTRTTTVPSRLSATAAKPKSPTSPVKSPVASKTTVKQPSTTVPSKPLAKTQVTKTTTRPLSSPPTRTIPSAASRTKPAGTLPSAKPAVPSSVGLSRTKPTVSPVDKKPITNGDIKAAPKRPEQLLTKTSTTKATMRPASAPVTKTVSKTTSTMSTTITRTKPPLNGPSKPKPLASVTQVKTAAKTSNEKEIKETANKQISTRTTTTVRSTTTAASKTMASATRKIESKVVTNGKAPALKPSSMVKMTTSSSKVPPKKPATTTRLKTTKTGSVVEKSETVQGSKTVVATNEVKSEVLIETTQTSAA